MCNKNCFIFQNCVASIFFIIPLLLWCVVYTCGYIKWKGRNVINPYRYWKQEDIKNKYNLSKKYLMENDYKKLDIGLTFRHTRNIKDHTCHLCGKSFSKKYWKTHACVLRVQQKRINKEVFNFLILKWRHFQFRNSLETRTLIEKSFFFNCDHIFCCYIK